MTYQVAKSTFQLYHSTPYLEKQKVIKFTEKGEQT